MKTQVLEDTLDQFELIDIYRSSHHKRTDLTFFSFFSPFSQVQMEHYLRTDHIQGQITSNLNKLQEIVIFSSIFSDHSVVRSDINHRKMTTTTRGNTNNLKAKPPKFKFEFNKIQSFYEAKNQKQKPLPKQSQVEHTST